MRLNAKATAALMVAALATGCADSDKTSPENVQPISDARVTPVSLNKSASTAAETITPDVTPKAVGPAKFADGEAAYQAGNYSEATRIFQQYTSEKPGNAWGQYMLGLSEWKSGNLAKAEAAFDEALKVDPKHMKSLVNLSRVMLEQGRSEDALGKLTLASEIDPNSAEIHRLLGRAYTAQGKIDDAMVSYRNAIQHDDKDAWSMNNLGFLFLEQGRPGEALPLLAKAVVLRKDVPVFHNNLGMALEHSGRFIAAAAEYTTALAGDPAYTKAQKNLDRVQAIKPSQELPFDLEATANNVVAEEKVEKDEKVPTVSDVVTSTAR